ncbi:MAG: tryptophan synthase subunit alpha [Phycisphaerae bacterium]|nr:tryptophan synthase subunit alpha [Phycisphaerae bacterium]
MTTYRQTFAKLKHAALIPFFVIGDPDYDTSLEIIKAAIDAGADVLELGIPFSDPIADGPTIQKADIRALAASMTTAKALRFIKAVTDYKPLPVGLLVYYNIVYRYGPQKFFNDFKAAGGSSVLVADLSIDDEAEITPLAEAAGLETVFMVTPNTEAERAERIARKSTGFIYTVSTLGVTGERQSLSETVKPLIKRLKGMTDTPVCVGFGISTPQHAKEIAAAGADGIIIGSRLVKIIEQNLGDKPKLLRELQAFLTEARSALSLDV